MTVTDGGVMSGRVRYCWIVPRPTLGNSTGRALRVVALPIVNLKSPPVAPTTVLSVSTSTVSLATNGFEGTKLTPWPSEWANSLPVWVPLLEPFTVTVPSAAASPPRNEIVVLAPAVGVPGIG